MEASDSIVWEFQSRLKLLFRNLIILLTVFFYFRSYKKYFYMENDILNKHYIDFCAIKLIQYGTKLIIII